MKGPRPLACADGSGDALHMPLLDAAEAADPPPPDMPHSYRFSWTAVDPGVIRSMLVAVYQGHGQDKDADAARDLDDGAALVRARRVMGEPPKAKYAPQLVDVMRDKWLPTLPPAIVREFVDGVQLARPLAERSELRTKKACVEFAQTHRKTNNFTTQLRKLFVNRHRVRLPVKGRTIQYSPRLAGPIDLSGLGTPDGRRPFQHQKDAWRNLDLLAQSAGPRAGLLVLPTGAGKTYTLVRWLVDQLAERPGLRVLWLVDRQELVDQAARTFIELGKTMPRAVTKRMRVVHGAANLPSAITDPQLDVVVITRQSLMSTAPEMRRQRLDGVLRRPTVVVVDEAHHAVAPTYDALLDEISSAFDVMLVGMTATPWPSHYGATARLKARFPVDLVTVYTVELVANGVLARPTFHTVQTNESVEMAPDELRQAVGRDLPSSVLRRLDRLDRNEVIVQAWLERREMWGKTLVFAVDIEHADSLGEVFTEFKASVDVIHSQSDEAIGEVLHRFRTSEGPRVLVSVGMLTEGVDVPQARTAFLARPTLSRILMRQMIGRVLRGPKAGGEPIAHIVDLRDRWVDDIEILSPIEIPGIIGEVEASEPGSAEHALPSIKDELTGEPIPEDVLRRVERQLRERVRGRSFSVGLTSNVLTGFYELALERVPVFEHTADRWTELINSTLKGHALGVGSPVQLFGDLPMPRPTPNEARAVIDYIEYHRTAPPLHEVRTVLSLRAVAAELLKQPAMTPIDRIEWLQQRYERSLARATYPTFQVFDEAVERELLVQAMPADVPTFNPEDTMWAAPRVGLPKLRRVSERPLLPLLRAAAASGREILADEPEYSDRLAPNELPAVEWTRAPVKGSWAYWTPRISGRSKGHAHIRINAVLRAPRTQIPDELLEFLLWHELCHYLTPNQGHDGEFRRLEALWPTAATYDGLLDDLRYQYQLH